MLKHSYLIMCAALFGVLSGCARTPEPQAVAETADEIRIPPAESRPANIAPSIKWFPESKRYQAIREDIYRANAGTDLKSRLDLGTERLSRHELYRVRILERPQPVMGEFQAWRVRIETADGKPVPNALFTVNGGMPQHGHGLSSQPQIDSTEVPGEYRIHGIQFSMPGWWVISLYISHQRQDDLVSFNVIAS